MTELAYINQLTTLQTQDRSLNASTASYFLANLNNAKNLIQKVSRYLLGSISETLTSRIQLSVTGKGTSQAERFSTAAPQDTTPIGIGIVGDNVSIKNSGDPYQWGETVLEVFRLNTSELYNLRLSIQKQSKSATFNLKSYQLADKLLDQKNTSALDDYRHLVATSFTSASDQQLITEVTEILNRTAYPIAENNQKIKESLSVLYQTKSVLTALRFMENTYSTILYLASQTTTQDRETLAQIKELSGTLEQIKNEISRLNGTKSQAPKEDSLFSKVMKEIRI